MNFRRTINTLMCLSLALAGVWLARIGYSALAGTGKNHALLIGISDYDQWDPLQSPAKDAEEIANALTERYSFSRSNITVLNDRSKEKPTLVNIITVLDRLRRELGNNDNLLVFFSGHSAQDEEGETYWIPKDGKKGTKLTWLSHSGLINEYFGSDQLKVKNLLILTDSVFSKKLYSPYSTPVGFSDLRYREKVLEKARLRSRELISFNDQHWPGTPKTDGLGLFAYNIRKALADNAEEVADFENLIFDDPILFEISKIAGTRLQRGRINSKIKEERGQFVLAAVGKLPLVNVTEVAVQPEKGYPGENFTFAVKTSDAASEVIIDIEGQKHRMKGKDNQWQYVAKVDKIGTIPFSVYATNANDAAGKAQQGQLTTIKKRGEIANVTAADVTPKEGKGGDSFKFTATTDKPAVEVAVVIKGKKFKMTGSGTQWSLAYAVEEEGAVEYSILASNEDGVAGTAKTGQMVIKPGPVSIAAVKTTPESGFAGEEFSVTVTTDRPAKSVALTLDGQALPMEGSGKNWRFKQKIAEEGTKSFTVAAINSEGTSGPAKAGQIVAKKTPLPIPDVARADVKVVAPGKGIAGDTYAFAVTTSAPADSVSVEIEGKPLAMKGSGTAWNIEAKVDKLGANAYKVVAKNKDGMQGKSVEGEITTQKPSAAPIAIASAQVNPASGPMGQAFAFKVKTEKPAAQVQLKIGNKQYPMTGKGTDWELSRKIEEKGDLKVDVVALNDDGGAGEAKSLALTVFETRFKANPDGTVTDVVSGQAMARFKNNGDGTITDLTTNLMWTDSPKAIPVSYEEANEYCRTLKIRGKGGWRLPTIRELAELTDKKQQNPSLPPGHPFANVVTHVGYWSKTPHDFGPNYVYQMSMWYGKWNQLNKSENAVVWPVRYAESGQEG